MQAAALNGVRERHGPLLRDWRGAASILCFFAVWALAAAMADSRVLPSPAVVFRALKAETAGGQLPYHLGITLIRVAVSFAIAMPLGVALGLALGRKRVDVWLHPWIIIFLNTPALVVIILTYVWLGLTEVALLVAVAANKIPNVAVTVREGARSLERDYAELARVYRFGRYRALREVVLPQLAPFLLAAARNGLALIWKIVLVVELLGRSNGVGFQLQAYFQLFDIARVVAYAVAFVACVLLIEGLIFGPLERHLGRWRR